jgi:hypothetical protein
MGIPVPPNWEPLPVRHQEKTAKPSSAVNKHVIRKWG